MGCAMKSEDMSDEIIPAFVVCADADPVVVKINGKANYLNCSPVNDFFEHVLAKGAAHFVVDFSKCEGMDSTFLGVLAGVATRTMRKTPAGWVKLVNLNAQNLQLIRGLGLHHLPTVQMIEVAEVDFADGRTCNHIEDELPGGEASADVILEAHERLMRLNRANEKRFQDVVRFLRLEAGKNP
jgi:anti-sigma B factor antagonist